jgi:hypothetical protein
MSPDGRLVAACTHPLTVWEVATGKKRFTIDAIQNAVAPAFSADSRFLATWEPGAAHVAVVDMRTGTVVRRFDMSHVNNGIPVAALSSDGKRVAVGEPTGRVTVWDVSTGETLAPFAGHDGPVTGAVFTADGKRLVTTAQDGTALVWEVPDKPHQLGPVENEVTGFDEAFRLLAATDPAQAQRGLDYLYRHPGDAVRQAGERVVVPASVGAAKIAQYVADLESDDFPTREAAVKALEKVGGEAATLLKEAREKSASAEVRKLAGQLLGKIDSPSVRPDDLLFLRVVEALEHLDTPEARAQLEKWAAGAPGHRLTVEAAAALARGKANDGK